MLGVVAALPKVQRTIFSKRAGEDLADPVLGMTTKIIDEEITHQHQIMSRWTDRSQESLVTFDEPLVGIPCAIFFRCWLVRRFLESHFCRGGCSRSICGGRLVQQDQEH